MFGPMCSFVLVGGGRYCQDLGSLKNGGKGLDGSDSALFFEIPRIIKILKEEFQGECNESWKMFLHDWC